MTRRALITGITGQDGVYLAHRLLACGYQVVGASRDLSDAHLASLGTLRNRVHVLPYDASSVAAWQALLAAAAPQELYHLAGPSFILDCIQDPVVATDALADAVVRMLEAVRRRTQPVRVFVAGSSEMFGEVEEVPQNEHTPYRPLHPYGIAKVFAHSILKFYRRQHGVFACMGILFNHESPRRSERFVTRKITLAAARIRLGLQNSVTLGNLDARRDWGFAGDYVRAMHLMLQAPQPNDYVIATGQQHTVRQFCELAFRTVGLDYQSFVQVDPALFRPLDRWDLCGDASRASQQLGWKPQVSFEQLVPLMVRWDLRQVARQNNLPLPPETP